MLLWRLFRSNRLEKHRRERHLSVRHAPKLANLTAAETELDKAGKIDIIPARVKVPPVRWPILIVAITLRVMFSSRGA
jgi:hypothetical protein